MAEQKAKATLHVLATDNRQTFLDREVVYFL